MKRSVLFLIAIIIVACVHAQDSLSKGTPYDVQGGFKPSFAVKWNPESLVFGKISVGGEYNFKNRRSLTLYAGIPVEIATTWKIENEKRKINMKTFSAMGGYRMYLKNNLHGLYFEPYLKYVHNEGSFLYIDQTSASKTPYFLSSDYSGGGLGAQLGVQWLIAKKLTVDFFFLGPEASIAKWNIDLQDQGNYDWDAQDAAEALDVLNNIINDLPNFISKNTETSVDMSSKTVKAHFSGILPVFRFGLSVGFRF